MSEIPSPDEVQERIPLTDSAAETVLAGRNALRAILDRKDPRLFVVVGPCSIHDPEAALDYARRLRRLADEVRDTLLLVMRVYFEKPRTAVGWKGFINDPFMDDSFRIDEGIARARALLMQLAELGLPTRLGGARPDLPAVSRRADLLVRDRRAHHRVADASRDGERPVDAGRLQERHRRRARGGHQRHQVGGAAARFPRRQQRRQDERDPLPRQPRTAIWCCAAAAGARTTTRSACGWPSRGWRRRSSRRNIVVDCSHANSMKDPTLQPLVFNDCVAPDPRGQPLDRRA